MSKTIAKPKKLKKCKNKGCENELPKGMKSYCSPKCATEAQRSRFKTRKWHKARSSTTKGKLDALWPKKVRELAGKCEYCGSKENLCAHHIYSRSNKNLRWDIDNGICLCQKHHTDSSIFSAHKTPLLFDKWLLYYKGQEFIDRLHEKSLIIKQVRR